MDFLKELGGGRYLSSLEDCTAYQTIEASFGQNDNNNFKADLMVLKVIPLRVRKQIGWSKKGSFTCERVFTKRRREPERDKHRLDRQRPKPSGKLHLYS